MSALISVVILQEFINRMNSRRRPIYRNREDPFSLPDAVFIDYFRLNKHLVVEICTELSSLLQCRSTVGTALSVDVKVLCALRFYATGSYQQSVANEFCLQISQSSASRAVRHVSEAIVKKLFAKWIVFPTNLSELQEIKFQFMRRSNFPGVIGAIDCTHIEIKAPPRNDSQYPEHVFLNRHMTHSLKVQMVCDADLKILSCNARYPGSSHVSFIWRNSSLRTTVQRIFQQNCKGWLVGNNGYPLEPWLMTPITTGVITIAEEVYNTNHRRAINPIERCFGVLKSRFCCLQRERVLHYSPPTAAYIIYACSILHNICKFHHVPDPQLEEENEESEDEDTVLEEVQQDQEIFRAGLEAQSNLIQNYFT